MSGRTHIVMIAPYPIVPPDEGGRVRAYNLLKHLAERYDVTLLSPPLRGVRVDLPIEVHECIPAGRRHQLASWRFLWRARRILRGRKPAAIIAEYIWHGPHGALLARMSRCDFVLDCPNVESDRFNSTRRRWGRAVGVWERIATRLADRLFVVTEADRERFIEKGVRASKIQVVPNGVDTSVMRPDRAAGARIRAELGIAPETRMLLFFGQLDYAPNVEALDRIRDALLPALHKGTTPFEIVIAGKGDAADLRARYSHPRVRFLGVVNPIADYINAADTVIVPITSGGGSRLKVIESIACGTRVVSTTLGAQGVDPALCGGLLDLSDEWEQFAELALQPPVRRDAAPDAFVKAFDWRSIVSRLLFDVRK
jgi:glycosyltransferase involved in cell wall biosynthesis